MPSVVGIFERRQDAERAASKLEAMGLSKEAISVLMPDGDSTPVGERAKVPHEQGEQPGIVKGISAVTGGVMGMTAATLLVPGVGPVMAVGMAAGALLGSVAGGAIGGKVEDFVFPGIPEQEQFLYEDALSKGRSAVIAVAADQTQAEAARGVFEYAGAESIDRARQMWWLGIRDIEKEKYATVSDFAADEPYFRQGFEAALRPGNRDKSYEHSLRVESAPELAMNPIARDAYRVGFERGSAYLKARRKAA